MDTTSIEYRLSKKEPRNLKKKVNKILQKISANKPAMWDYIP